MHHTTPDVPALPARRHLTVTHWTPAGQGLDSDLIFGPLNIGQTRGRVSVAIFAGLAQISLSPTVAEARQMIDALQWSIGLIEAKLAPVPAAEQV